MKKRLAGAVRSASGRENLTAIGERDLVLALAAAETIIGTKEGTIGVSKIDDASTKSCPHVDYPASA